MFWQHCLPQHIISRLVGYLANNRTPWVKNTFIQWFIKQYNVDMSLAEESDASHYATFNAFFTRTLKASIRPIDPEETAIISPVDGVISQIGDITNGRIFQAKQFDFSTLELLGGYTHLADHFHQGKFATLYLSPKDYHRVHMPFSGTLSEMVYVPGRLFSVNNQSTEYIPRLFARNERAIALFETSIGKMAIVLVGAMIVAGIETVWAGSITPTSSRKIQHQIYNDSKIYLEKGKEMGLFKLGSTAIVLFDNPTIEWEKHLTENSNLVLGQRLGVIHSIKT